MDTLEQSVLMMELALRELPKNVYGFFIITDDSGMRKMGSTMNRDNVLSIAKELVERASLMDGY